MQQVRRECGVGLALATALAGILAVPGPALAQSGSAAEQAVEAARQYAGSSLTITWEAGLQALDPLNFSGPLWEELTGIRINVVEVPFDEMFVKTMAEHRAATGAYDVLNVVPSQMPDLVRAACWSRSTRTSTATATGRTSTPSARSTATTG